MLHGAPIRAIKSKIVGPFTRPTTVEVVSTTLNSENNPASLVWITKSEAECNVGKGFPLEPGTKIEVDLEIGQAVWAITQNLARIGVSVKRPR